MKTEEEKFLIAQVVEKLTLFLEERNWVKYHHPKEMATAIAVEYMELLEIFLEGSSFSPTDLQDEIGDVYFSLTSLYNSLHMERSTLAFSPLPSSTLPPLQLLLRFGVNLGRLMEHFQWLREEESRSMTADDSLLSSYAATYAAFRLFCKSVNVDPHSAVFAKIQKTALKYPAEMVSTDREKYVQWKKKLKTDTG
jgi:NTP pyrophosphatase (non-canonical NTP hydrolase)